MRIDLVRRAFAATRPGANVYQRMELAGRMVHAPKCIRGVLFEHVPYLRQRALAEQRSRYAHLAAKYWDDLDPFGDAAYRRSAARLESIRKGRRYVPGTVR